MRLLYLLSIPPLVSLKAIILNIYNGDILGINANLEYMIWHIVPLSIFFFRYLIFRRCDELNYYFAELSTYILGIAYNIYWYYEWKEDRHRTEYYDTQTFLLCFYVMILIRRVDIEIFSESCSIIPIQDSTPHHNNNNNLVV